MGERAECKALFANGIPPGTFSIISEENEELKKMEEEPSESSTNNRWTYILIIAGISTTFGSSLPVGYNIGVINTPAEIIKQFCNESFQTRYDTELNPFGLNLFWSFVVSIFVVGGVTGSCLGALVADNVGRKGGIIITNLLSLIGAICFIGSFPSNSVELLFIGRILVGLSGGLTTSIVPMYLMEISPINLRGSMGVMCPLGVTFGVLVGQIMGLDMILGTSERWHYLLAFFGILVIIFTPFLFILPESPKYLLAVRSDYDGAIKALCRIRNKPMSSLSHDISDLQAEGNDVDSDTDTLWSLKRVIGSSNLRIALALVCLMQAGQQTSGINAVFYYSNSIFLKANLTPWEAQLGTLGAGIINCTMAVLAIPLMAYCSRRMLAITSMGLSTVCLVMLCITIKVIDMVEWMPKLCIAAVLLYVLFYGLGLGPIPYIIGSELFEVGPRPAAMSLGSLCNWGGNLLVSLTFPLLQESIGAYSFLLFATSTALLCTFVYFNLPETRGKTASEVALMCQNRRIRN